MPLFTLLDFYIGKPSALLIVPVSLFLFETHKFMKTTAIYEGAIFICLNKAMDFLFVISINRGRFMDAILLLANEIQIAYK